MIVTAVTFTNPEHTMAKTVYDGGLIDIGEYPSANSTIRRAQRDFLENGGLITTFTRITPEQIAEERDRRLALGFFYDFGDARGVHHIGTTKSDLEGWDEVSKWSSACMALGLTTNTITVLTNTGPAIVTAVEWQQILLAATAARQPIWGASFLLQSQNPIPSDYMNDSYWQQ
jgi:hypothetical protein